MFVFSKFFRNSSTNRKTSIILFASFIFAVLYFLYGEPPKRLSTITSNDLVNQKKKKSEIVTINSESKDEKFRNEPVIVNDKKFRQLPKFKTMTNDLESEEYTISTTSESNLPTTLKPKHVKISFENAPNRSALMIREDKFQKHRTCKMPYVYPYEKSTLQLLRQDLEGVIEPHCLSKARDRFTTNQNTKLIRLNPNATFWKNNNCCYTPFTGYDENYKNLTACIDIIDDITTIPSVWNNIQVLCNEKQFPDNLTYRDYFHFLRLNTTAEKLLDKLVEKTDYNPNVILLGLDTVSLTNFQRFLPKSRKFLIEELGAIEFTGMNKIGMGTMENMIPMISNCEWSPGGQAIFPENGEECTQVWQHYSAKGYRTIWSVEEYYVLLNQKMRHDDKGTHNMTYCNIDFVQALERTGGSALDAHGCYEHKLAFEILSDRLLQVARKLRGKPYFHFLWSVTETHQLTALAQYLDNPLLELLKIMVAENLLEDTILMVLSDHGMVSSYYATTFEGGIEANAPFLYTVFPKGFKEKYSTGILNMKRNSRGLVTPHDIYQTLLSILNLSSVTNRQLEAKPPSEIVGKSRNKGISLFQPIPLNRTCETAFIPELNCLCWSWTEVQNFNTNRHVKAAAIYVVEYINKNLEPFPNCAVLKLQEIQGGKTTSDAFGNTFLSVTFSTTPSKAIFQAMVSRKAGVNAGVNAGDNAGGTKSKSDFELVGTVERKNKYGKQSACLGSKMQKIGWIRSVCFCKDFKLPKSDEN